MCCVDSSWLTGTKRLERGCRRVVLPDWSLSFGSIVFRRAFGWGYVGKIRGKRIRKTTRSMGFHGCMLARIGCFFYFAHTLGRPYEERRTLGDGSIEALLADNERQEAAWSSHRASYPYVDPWKNCRVSLRLSSFSQLSTCWVFFVKIYQDDGTIHSHHPLGQRIAFSGADDASMLSVLKRKQSVSCIAQLR